MSMSKLRELSSAQEVIEALGGVAAVGRRFARESKEPYKAAYAWYQAGDFPPKLYVAMTAALREKRCSAPPKLWRMAEAAA